MKDKKREERLLDIFLKYFDYPKGDMYDGESILRMVEYCNWLKENGLKVTPDGYPKGLVSRKVTKPKGKNPELEERDKEIRSEFYNLHDIKGYKATTVYKMLAKKYNLSEQTIKSYTSK